MKFHSLAILSLLSFIRAKLIESTASTATAAILDIDESNINRKLVECTVSEVHGFVPPGSPQLPDQYACTTDEGDALFLDGEASALLGAGFVADETRLALAPQIISSGRNISVQQAMAPGAVADRNIFGGRTRKLTTTGNKSVLVIRVDSDDYAPSQSEAKMHDDVFVDDNNLRVRYEECSNGALIFQPATGTNVKNGVLTVTTSNNLNGMAWQNCGTIAINGASGISRDFTMIVCPDVVNFGGAAAWGSLPGSVSWYRSMYASAPIIQMHEIGHNLGHSHSGKGGVTYKDPTCNMGNQGSWSDAGTNFCFNAAKTWANKWYESYHVTVDPTRATYDGTLVGINAVKNGSITAGQDVVLKISSSAETDLYVMFNRKDGANDEVPGYGDQVVIIEQGSGRDKTSSWLAGLSETGVTAYTQSWPSSGTLTVKVCSLNALDTGPPGGTARILVYATGHATLSCDVSTPAPTNTPVTPEPTNLPVTSPPTNTPVTPEPTNTPVTSPPTNTPVTPAPTNATGASPPASARATLAPTQATVTPPPTITPVTPAPTKATVTSPPTKMPVTSPTTDSSYCQDNAARFTFNGRRPRTCTFVNKRTGRRCSKDGAAENCPITCKTGCTCFDTQGKFWSNGKRRRYCKWAAKKNESRILKICTKRNEVRSNCPLLCKVC